MGKQKLKSTPVQRAERNTKSTLPKKDKQPQHFPEKKGKKSIKTKISMMVLVPICLLCLIFGITGCFLNYNTAHAVLEQSISESAQVAADQVAAEILAIQNVAIENGCSTVLSNPEISLEEKSALIEHRSALHGFQRGNLLSTEGISYFDGNDYSDRDYFKAAMNGNAFISTPTISKVTGKITFLVSAPVWQNGVPGSEIVGVIYYVPDENFLNNIVNSIKINDSGFAYIIDKNGTNVADRDPALVGVENSIKDAETDPALEKLADIEHDMIAGNTGYGSYFYDGEDWVQGYAPVKNTDGWSLGVAALEKDFLGNFYLSLIITIVLAVIFIIVGVIAATTFANSISRPIQKFSERIRNLSKGDLTSPVEVVNRKDEVGILSSSTKDVVDGLSDIIRDLTYLLGQLANGNLDVVSTRTYAGDFVPIQTAMTGIIDSLNISMNKIHEVSWQISSGADHVSSGAQSLAQGATEQASSVEELAATVGRVSEHVRRTAESAEKARDCTNQAESNVKVCNDKMQEMILAMDEINDKSAEIGKIIKVIEDIAFQTNILALNAAVEAARAGMAGKGFAVVADEVRNLANKSAEAAKNTATLIGESIHSVEKGSRIASETADSMTQVEEITQSASSLVEQIAKASEEEAKVLSQITQGIDQISSVIQTNSASSEESAATSEELSGNAQTLKEIVGKFQLKMHD